ncbi:MAG: hypothetical protein IPH15_06810 [Comamonadaceae bacterium]|nr:hypothetical protein [Comamonadaceae bacterium]
MTNSTLKNPSLQFTTAALLLAGLALPAQARDEEIARGVNPKDNISKVDLIYKRDNMTGDASVQSLSFKYDQALNADWGVNLELPTVKYSSPLLNEAGLGDVQFRIRKVTNFEQGALILGAEAVAPTASHDALGLGKWQLNPVVGFVYSFTPMTFLYMGYKHLYSVGGDSARPDINMSQPRMLLAYTSPKGWWVLGDLKYTRDHNSRNDLLDCELEVGQMLTHNMALSARIGAPRLDTTRTFGFSLNGRYIF